MLSFMLRRLGMGALTIASAVVAAFVLVRLTGDPALLIAGPDATHEQLQQVRDKLGTDQPVANQLVEYLQNAFQGDFGQSIFQNRPAIEVIVERLPATLMLLALAFTLALSVSIPLGVLAAAKSGTKYDMAARLVAAFGQSVPVFWLGIMLIVVFAVKLRLLPSGGGGSFAHLILPAASIAVMTIPIQIRVLRSALLEVLGQDYIRMARSKGCSTKRVLFGHALKNAAVPFLSVLGYSVGHILGATVVVETVYNFPGMGSAAIHAILVRDFPTVQAFLFVLACSIVLINLIVDVALARLDPRIRHA